LVTKQGPTSKEYKFEAEYVDRGKVEVRPSAKSLDEIIQDLIGGEAKARGSV